MKNTITIKQTLSFAWGRFKDNASFLVFLTLSMIVVSSAIERLGGQPTEAFVFLLSLFFSFFASFSLIKVGLATVRGKKASWNDVFSDIDWKLFGLFAVSSILFTIAYVLGLILLIIPGIIIMVRGAFYGFALVDEKIGPVHAIKRSFSITKGNFWRILGLAIVLFLINVLGALLFFVGLLITIPLCLISMAYVYDKLKSAPVTVASAPVEPVPAAAPTAPVAPADSAPKTEPNTDQKADDKANHKVS